jgi:hypothetical protein
VALLNSRSLWERGARPLEYKPRRWPRFHSRPAARFFRPKNRNLVLPPPPVVWKKPLRPKIKRAKSSLRRVGLLRYPIAPPPAGFVPTKHAWRIRIKRAKRFVKTPKLYSIAGPPVGFVPTKHAFRIRIKRGKRFVKVPKLYSIAGPPAGFAPVRRKFQIRIKRARRFIRFPRLYSIAGPPASFIAFKKPPRAKIKRMRIRLRPRTYSILPSAVVLYRKLPRLKIKRARRFIRLPRLYSISGPPESFIATKRMLRPRIKRAKLRLRPRQFPILPSAVLLYRKLPRLKIKRARRFTKLPRLYSIAGPPVGFIATKRMWRVRIKRGRRFVKPARYPIVKPLLVLFRKFVRLKIKRGRKFVQPHRYPNMDPPAGFAPLLPERVLQLHSRPLLRFFRSHTRPYPIAGPPVGFIAFKKPPRPKIRRARIRIRPRTYPIVTGILVLYRALRRLKIKRGRHFTKLPRTYSISGPPIGFIAFKKPPRAKVRRGKIDIRRFIKRFFVPFVPPPVPPVTTPPPGSGKRRIKGLPKYISPVATKPLRQMTAGDAARAKIFKKVTGAAKSKGLLITEEEMFLLLHALEDDDED